MLINSKNIINSVGSTPADIDAIIAVINDIFERFPEKFGDAENRHRLEQSVDAFLQQRCDPKDFFSWLANTLEQNFIGNPFSGFSLVFVGGYTGFNKDGFIARAGEDSTMECTYSDATPILKLFSRFVDIAVHKTGYLKTKNSLELIGREKVDYVITGNVINSPDNYFQEDTILACGNMLKKGGRVIHALHYGEDSPRERIGNPWLERFAGQLHIYNIPEGKYQSRAFHKDATNIMVLEQVREVNHKSEKSMYWFRGNRVDYFLGDTATEWIISGDGKECGSKTFIRYLLDHPEELEAAHYPDYQNLKEANVTGRGEFIQRAVDYENKYNGKWIRPGTAVTELPSAVLTPRQHDDDIRRN